MAVAHVEKLGVKLADALVDPGGPPPCARGGAALDDAVIGAIDANLEFFLLDDAREPPRHMQMIQREDAAPFGLDPIERRIVRTFRHWENATRIGLEQYLRRNFNHQVRGSIGAISLGPALSHRAGSPRLCSA